MSHFFVSRNTQTTKAAIGCLFKSILNNQHNGRLFVDYVVLLISRIYRRLTSLNDVLAPLIGVCLATFLRRLASLNDVQNTIYNDAT
jgi:hypothetical protein